MVYRRPSPEPNLLSGPELDAKVASLKGGRVAAWSTDLATAWELLEEMRVSRDGKTKLAIAVHVGAGEAPWECSLVTNLSKQDHTGSARAFSDTPAAAICMLYILRAHSEFDEVLKKDAKAEALWQPPTARQTTINVGGKQITLVGEGPDSDLQRDPDMNDPYATAIADEAAK